MRTSQQFEDLPRLLALATGDEKHDAATTSTLDVLWVLYDRVLRVDPLRPDDPARDRFVLSKGHGPASYYAVLAAKGFLDIDELRDFAGFDSRLGLHPDRQRLPGVEVSSGSLGHGLPIAVGIALALRAAPPTAERSPRVVCLLGDGECDEGSVWEAVSYAGRIGLAELTAVVVDNASSTWGWPGGIGGRFAAEGWHAASVDGRHHDALTAALTARHDVPSVVVAEISGSSA